MVYKFIAVMLLVSCAHAPPTLEERCTPLLKDILAIQGNRNASSDQMGEYTRMYKEHEISLKKYKLYFNEWLELEISLRDKVTSLYDIAYNTGCM